MSSLIPTKGNLIAAKRSRALAETGFELMDRKRNILIRELMQLIDQASDLQGRVDATFQEAYGALMLANISVGGCERLAESVPVDESLRVRYRSVMGVEIPIVTAEEPKSGTLPYGFADSSSEVDAAYISFCRVKRLITELAETENAIFRLAYSVKKTRKRANALKNIVIPGLDADISRISDALEEKEREEFARLKVIKRRKNG